MTEILDIVALVKNNPLTKFSNQDYDSKIIEKLKVKFNSDEEKLFLANFYGYANYNPNKDFVINLDRVWKWLGYTRVDNCKTVLIKNFKEDIDYRVENFAPATSGAKTDADKDHENLEKEKKSFPEVAGKSKPSEKSEETRGGHNKEYIIMTINCFKKLCLKSKTTKADDIHEYYVKLEEVMHDMLLEESEKLRKQLSLKDKEIEVTKEKTMLKAYSKKPINYLILINDEDIKFGYSNDIEARFATHKKEIGENIKLIFVLETVYNRELEQIIKQNLKEYVISKEYLGKVQTEIIHLNETFTAKKLQDTLILYKDSLNSGELITKLINENEELKKEVKELKINPQKEDNTDGDYIYIEHIENTLDEYRVDVTNDKKYELIYPTKNAKKVKTMLYTLLNSYKVKENIFAMSYEKIKKALEYTIVMYDNYQIEKSEYFLYTYLTRHNDDKIIMNKSKRLIDKEKFDLFLKENVEYGESYKVTVIQLYDVLLEWWEEKFNEELSIPERDLKEEIIKQVKDTLKLERQKISITDKSTQTRYSSYPGFIGFRLIETNTYLYNENVYKDFVKETLVVTKNQDDKYLRTKLIDNFETWLSNSKYTFNPESKGNVKYTPAFYKEITNVVKNILSVEFEADRYFTTQTLHGKRGYFVGIKDKIAKEQDIIICEHCGKEYTNRHSLRTHINRNHKN